MNDSPETREQRIARLAGDDYNRRALLQAALGTSEFNGDGQRQHQLVDWIDELLLAHRSQHPER